LKVTAMVASLLLVLTVLLTIEAQESSSQAKRYACKHHSGKQQRISLPQYPQPPAV